MVALRSLREALRALADAPVAFAGGLIYALVVAPQSALSLAGVPVLPNLVSLVTFFVTPFVVAGLIGMAAEALDGATDLSTFATIGRERYLPVLLGNLLEFGVVVLVGIAAAVVGLVALLVFGAGLAATGGGPMTGALGVGGVLAFGGLGLLFVLAILLVAFLIQFYPVAIVHDGADVVEGFRLSYRLVRDNLIAALGFSLVVLFVNVLTAVPVGALVLARVLQDGGFDAPSGGTGSGPAMDPGVAPAAGTGSPFSLPEVLALTAVATLLTALLFTFRQTYATAFYRAAR